MWNGAEQQTEEEEHLSDGQPGVLGIERLVKINYPANIHYSTSSITLAPVDTGPPIPFVLLQPRSNAFQQSSTSYQLCRKSALLVNHVMSVKFASHLRKVHRFNFTQQILSLPSFQTSIWEDSIYRECLQYLGIQEWQDIDNKIAAAGFKKNSKAKGEAGLGERHWCLWTG